MAIEILYRVTDRRGEVVGEYMDSKLANIIDKRTDVMYEIADKLIETGVAEAQADAAAEMILNDRQMIMNLLKTVKDIPSPQAVETKAEAKSEGADAKQA